MGVSDTEREQIRDVVLTHAHLDHTAGLPLFLDDLFSSLSKPVRVHAAASVIEALERDIFNWSVYPRFSELNNGIGPVVEYCPFANGDVITIEDLTLTPIAVNHKVPSSGFVISSGENNIAITGDTSAMDVFWEAIEDGPSLDALLIECAFPDELSELASISHHLTPATLKREIERFGMPECPVYVINIKPAYRDVVIPELTALRIRGLEILEVGLTYEW